MQRQRYHPWLVLLHWVLAVLILLQLCAGFFGLAQTPNGDPNKLDVLRTHMASGMLVLFLMLVRLAVRWRTAQPPQGLRRYLHYGFYALVVALAATGMTTTLLARLNEIVFARSGEPLRPTCRSISAACCMGGWRSPWWRCSPGTSFSRCRA